MKVEERKTGRRWAALGAGCFGIWLFVFVLAPWLQGFGPVATLHTFIEERGIDATPLFYSESEASSLSERFLLDAARFQPREAEQGGGSRFSSQVIPLTQR